MPNRPRQDSLIPRAFRSRRYQVRQYSRPSSPVRRRGAVACRSSCASNRSNRATSRRRSARPGRTANTSHSASPPTAPPSSEPRRTRRTAAPDPGARLAVLRAFQAWAVHANVNIGLVPDSGAAFGTGGGGAGRPAVRRRSRRRAAARAGRARDHRAVPAVRRLLRGRRTEHRRELRGGRLRPVHGDAARSRARAGRRQQPGRVVGDVRVLPGQRAGLSAADVAAIRALYGARARGRVRGARPATTRSPPPPRTRGRSRPTSRPRPTWTCTRLPRSRSPTA